AGTPEFAVPSLRAAARKAEIVAVYTQPDRPAGRGRDLHASPVKLAALELGFPVLQPDSLKSELSRDALRALQPDLMVVVATGPVLLSQRTPIGPGETAGQLHDRLAELGAQVLADGLGLLRAGMKPVVRPQPDAGATYARKLEKSEARLDWSQPAPVLARKVRAFHPWPVAEAALAGERVRIHAAEAVDVAHDAAPGSVLQASRAGIDVACGEGALRITRLQREGGRALAAADYLNARPLAAG